MSKPDEDEFRAHLIEVGRDAMGRNDGWRWWHPRHLARLLDVLEPLIRADERREVAEDIATRIEDDDQPGHRYDHATATERAAAIARQIGGAS